MSIELITLNFAFYELFYVLLSCEKRALKICSSIDRDSDSFSISVPI